MTKALISGSFDPVTNGHMNLIERTAKIFDEVHVVVFINPDKKTMFTVEDRERFLKAACTNLLPDKKITVGKYDGYVVDYVAEHGIHTIVKGIRNDNDLIYEREMADINRVLHKGAETMFLITDKLYEGVSSTLVREHIISRQSPAKYIPYPVWDLISDIIL